MRVSRTKKYIDKTAELYPLIDSKLVYKVINMFLTLIIKMLIIGKPIVSVLNKKDRKIFLYYHTKVVVDKTLLNHKDVNISYWVDFNNQISKITKLKEHKNG